MNAHILLRFLFIVMAGSAIAVIVMVRTSHRLYWTRRAMAKASAAARAAKRDRPEPPAQTAAAPPATGTEVPATTPSGEAPC